MSKTAQVHAWPYSLAVLSVSSQLLYSGFSPLITPFRHFPSQLDPCLVQAFGVSFQSAHLHILLMTLLTRMLSSSLAPSPSINNLACSFDKKTAAPCSDFCQRPLLSTHTGFGAAFLRWCSGSNASALAFHNLCCGSFSEPLPSSDLAPLKMLPVSCFWNASHLPLSLTNA